MNYTTLASITDIDGIFDILNSHDHIYGHRIDEIKIKLKNLINQILNREISGCIILHYEDNQITGVGIARFFQNVWVISLVLMKWKDYNIKNQIHGGHIFASLVQQAEQRGLKEFYWAAREEKSSKYNRLKIVLEQSDILDRYEIYTIEKLGPYTTSKHELINQGVLCDLAGKNKKPIAIRKAVLK